MRKVIVVLFLIDIISFIIGFFLKSNHPNKGHLIIGLSLLFLMFILIPLFLFIRYSKKQTSDFVLKKEDKEN